jgi:hypothetical protein
VAVIAPGGGTGINGAVYADLGKDPGFCVEIVGRSRAPYDCYPPDWPEGRSAPNLASFAQEVLGQSVLDRSDILIVGSRGGQVVLPALWQARGGAVPPALVINGGVAMNLPTPVRWPETAVTFLLLGGQDYFRGNQTPDDYVADAKSRVPKANDTTAILYVEEMQHMPQAQLLGALLRHMLKALRRWKVSCMLPLKEFRYILETLQKELRWSGFLSYTKAPGVWENIAFGPFEVVRLPSDADSVPPAGLARQWPEESPGALGCSPAATPISRALGMEPWHCASPMSCGIRGSPCHFFLTDPLKA